MEPTTVIQLGNPVLRMHAESIDDAFFGSEELDNLGAELFRVMEADGGVGLAAPQIGISKRIIVFGMETHAVYKDPQTIPYTLLINPSFEPLSGVIEEQYEGCLSVGKLRAKVPRYKTIGYRGYDVEGNLIEREASDLHARVVQHELDHLNGIIFLDKVTDYHSMGFHEELIHFGKLR